MGGGLGATSLGINRFGGCLVELLLLRDCEVNNLLTITNEV
jgi:hypothetical protein